MTELIATATQGEAFRAQINEAALFKNMKHIFKSTFTVLGELMQNSRRAGATYVAFDYDPVKRSLVISDDGAGVSDFSKLVHLCESGWDDDVKLADNPFGMGFFAAFFTGESVTVKSKGHNLSLTLNDVVHKRLMAAKSDPTAPTKGTRIELTGLNEKFLEKGHRSGVQPEDSKLYAELLKFARGFPIDVTFNGKPLPRPHAKLNLKGVHSPIGFVSCGHIHDGREASALPLFTTYQERETALYLQGLPIQVVDALTNAHSIIHLDNELFTPVLPDRTYLFDATEKFALIKTTVLQMVRDFLAKQKSELPDDVFVKTYWTVCETAGCLEMMNDVPFLPTTVLATVDSVDARVDEGTSQLEREGDLVRYADIKSGSIRVWRNAPSDVSEEKGHGALLKLIQRNDIAICEDRSFHPGHWIREIAPDCNDFVVTLSTKEVLKKQNGYFGSHEVEIRFVECLNVTVTSTTDAWFSYTEVIDDDWVFEKHGDDLSDDVICFVMSKDNSPDHPVNALSDYEDDDGYNEHWYDTDSSLWNSVVGAMRGQKLAGLVKRHINDLPIEVTNDLAGQVTLVMAVQDPYAQLLSIDLENQKRWDQLATLLEAGHVSGDKLKQLFMETMTADEETEKSAS